MSKKAKKKFETHSTIDESEVSQFEKLGQKWWDESGPMAPLHRLNPTRLEYIRDQITGYYDCMDGIRALEGLSILDIGCGGGLVTEPLSRMGATVTGIDAGAENIRVATNHAQDQGLDIEYIATTSEGLAKTGRKFDVVTALEIIEHVSDVPLFIQSALELVADDGMVIFSTLNRTPKSYLLGIVGAEYILRWLPRGTHQWKKFLRPSEIARPVEALGFSVTDVSGMVFHPISGQFSISKTDMDVNYFLTAVKR